MLFLAVFTTFYVIFLTSELRQKIPKFSGIFSIFFTFLAKIGQKMAFFNP
jgi:hypothetical protein